MAERSFREVRQLFERHGWTHTRTHGSHHVFTKPGDRLFSIPVHNGKVKAFYVRQIERFFRGAEEEGC